MSRMWQFRDPELSLWQSVVDEELAKRQGSAARPDLSHPMLREATAFCAALESGKPAPQALAASLTKLLNLHGTVVHCSLLGMKVAKALIAGNHLLAEKYKAELKFGACDPCYIECAEKYADYFLAHKGQIPYRRYSQLTDFIIDNRLPANARIGIVGDWGTGRPEAAAVLKQLAATHPDIAIHLGDIYYSGTEYEVDNYFYQLWQGAFGDLVATGKTFTLTGNHEMFCGGVPYYRLIDRLGQPASYFCLRNEHWQIIGIDTALHDHDPLCGKPTYLEDSEVAWLRHKLDNASGRGTILLSHHQLFTSKEDIGGQAINQKLYEQLQSCLPRVNVWLWGHEHDLVIYKNYLRVLGRCVGHGAFPVALDDLPKAPRFPDVPIEPVVLANDGITYDHGYATILLDGPSATIQYWQDSTPGKALFEEKI